MPAIEFILMARNFAKHLLGCEIDIQAERSGINIDTATSGENAETTLREGMRLHRKCKIQK